MEISQLFINRYLKAYVSINRTYFILNIPFFKVQILNAKEKRASLIISHLKVFIQWFIKYVVNCILKTFISLKQFIH